MSLLSACADHPQQAGGTSTAQLASNDLQGSAADDASVTDASETTDDRSSADAGSKVRPPPDRIPPGSYEASLVSQKGVTHATWVFDESGAVSATPFKSWQLYVDDVMSERVQRRHPISLTDVSPCTGSKAPPAPPSVAPEKVLFLLTAPPLCGRLTLPGEREAARRLQLYGREPGDASIIVLWPEPGVSGLRPIVLAGQYEGSFSPGGPWRATALGDLDGDGRDDLAFVSEGIEDCDRPPCDLFWINVIMTGAHTIMGADQVLITSGSLMSSSSSSSSAAPPRAGSARWSGVIRNGSYEVTMQGPAGRRRWVVRLDSGELRVVEQPRAGATGSRRKGAPVGSRPSSSSRSD